MRSYTSSRNFLGSKVGIYIDLYAITNNYCVVSTRNDFCLPATLMYHGSFQRISIMWYTLHIVQLTGCTVLSIPSVLLGENLIKREVS